MLSDIVGKRVIGVRRAEESLNAEKHRADLKCRAPLVLQDVQANPSETIDVGVIDSCQKPHLGRAVRETKVRKVAEEGCVSRRSCQEEKSGQR